uniref:G-protein coupled receptors family 2 profile 2 domain-containing protein n=1 Tax=Sinocyclocheilus rhinocerous TaxID=307959 RepID=A0A673MT56_9TELE
MHLFFMAAFSWMLVEGLLLWSKVVSVNLSEDRHMKYYYLIGWGNASPPPISSSICSDGHCWLSVQNGVIWAAPVVTPEICLCVCTIVYMHQYNKIKCFSYHSSAFRAAVKAVLVLLPILGLTWLCGVLVPFSVVIAYIFSLLNSLQVRVFLDAW